MSIATQFESNPLNFPLMKLRIKGASVRLRLTQTEVKTFEETGVWSDETPLPGGRLKYTLLRSESDSDMSASWVSDPIGACLTVVIPEPMATEWKAPNAISMRGSVDVPDGPVTTLLVEKDFACLDNTEEDQSDNFPNPNAIC